MRRHHWLLAVLFTLAGCAPKAETSEPTACAAQAGGAVAVTGAWVRAQPDEGGMSAAYFELCNGSEVPVVITGVAAGFAGVAEMHESTRSPEGVVAMAPTGPLSLGAGEAVSFAPGGKHVMLMSLASALDEGAPADFEILLEGGAKIPVTATVRSSAPEAGTHEH